MGEIQGHALPGARDRVVKDPVAAIPKDPGSVASLGVGRRGVWVLREKVESPVMLVEKAPDELQARSGFEDKILDLR